MCCHLLLRGRQAWARIGTLYLSRVGINHVTASLAGYVLLCYDTQSESLPWTKEYTMTDQILPPVPTQPKIELFERVNRGEAPPSYRASRPASKSLDIPQRFERTLARYNASDSIWKRWLFEIVSWATSAACIVSPYYLTFFDSS